MTRRNIDKTSREEEIYVEQDHKLQSTLLVRKGHGGVCSVSDTQAHPPQNHQTRRRCRYSACQLIRAAVGRANT